VGPKIKRLAVIAHRKKTLGGGLTELRSLLAEAGHREPLWYEVSKSKKAPREVLRALEAGAELLFVWGGDGMVQRCIDALAGSNAALAILPAGTANLLATNLGIPPDLARALDIGLHGARRRLDVGVINGERFAVMAGSGFDSRMIRKADGASKKRLGKLAYVRGGVSALGSRPVRTRIRVDGEVWFEGKASSVLVGNVGKVAGGVKVFASATPWDGILEVGVVTAKSVWQWVRVLSRAASGRADRSPFVELTRGREIVVELGRKRSYELDGGIRPAARRLRIHVEPAALTICMPRPPRRQRAVPSRP
jgi:diacylglycerol kinase (ATP)